VSVLPTLQRNVESIDRASVEYTGGLFI